MVPSLVMCPIRENRYARLFGKAKQFSRAFADLRNASGRGFDLIGENRLNGINDQQARIRLGNLLKDVFELGLGQHIEPVVAQLQPIGAHLDLLLAFFSADIQYRYSFHTQGDLQHQGGFTDPRFATQQHQGSRYQSAAQHAIKFRIRQDYAFSPPALMSCSNWGFGVLRLRSSGFFQRLADVSF